MLGPTSVSAELGASWSLARAAFAAARAGALQGEGPIVAAEHLGDVLLFGGRLLGARIGERRLTPLGELTEKAATRMRETALAFVRQQGNAVAIAAELGIHPQTARYRIGRLRDLLGEQLDDPDARFEIEASLRIEAFSANAEVNPA